MSQAQLEKKVEDYLRDSQALEDYWQKPITQEELQAEVSKHRDFDLDTSHGISYKLMHENDNTVHKSQPSLTSTVDYGDHGHAEGLERRHSKLEGSRTAQRGHTDGQRERCVPAGPQTYP